MRTVLALMVLVAACALGCDQIVPQASPTSPSAKAPAPEKNQPAPAPQSTPVAPQPGEPETPMLKSEPLPELPKADPKSVVKELNKDKTLFIETMPNDKKRILLVAEVCLRQGLLEVLMCKKNTKEHEAILRTDIDARYIHASLVAIGAEKGNPVQFVNPQTNEIEYKAASGQTIKITVCYQRDGKVHTHPAQEWILDKTTKKPMKHEWVFAGSRFVKNPDRPDDPPYYCANNGEVIAISNFSDSMLDLPVKIGHENDDLFFDAETKRIPPLLSKVWVILEPVAKEAKPKK